MPNNAYKKRAKGSWCAGKGYKEDSNSEERQFAKKEALVDPEQDTPYKKKRKKNEKAILEYWISYYTQKIEEYERSGISLSYTSYLTDALKKKQKELATKYPKKT